jgi:hypothetical protein
MQRKIPQSGTKAVLCHRFALMSADLRSKTTDCEMREEVPILESEFKTRTVLDA